LLQLFEPFLTTKTQGTGLGLAISRTIVEAHGGRIYAENNPDGGACIRIELPGAREQGTK
jgi:two-component system sensor kinase FixL